MTQTSPSKIDAKLSSLYDKLENLFDARERGFYTGPDWHESVSNLKSQIKLLKELKE